MKKNLILTLAFAGMLSLGSCQSDEPAASSGNEVAVSFSVDVPQSIQSRSFGDGTSATSLTAIVYQKDEKGNYTMVAEKDGLTFDQNREVSGVKTTYAAVSFNLMKAETYKIVFWAQAAEGAPYVINSDNATIAMNYGDEANGYKTDGNNENRDAFYATYGDFTVSEALATQTVKLYRPFAQLNIGASDLAEAKAAGYHYLTAQVKAKTYSSLNLLSGEASDLKDVTFEAAAISDMATQTFPTSNDEKSYSYIAMDYLLINEKQELIPVSMELNTCGNDCDGKEIHPNVTKSYSYDNVPVRRNYRTNIYGSLFTEQFDYEIFKDPKFNSSFNNVVTKADEFDKALAAGSNIMLMNDLTVSSVSLKSEVASSIDLNGYTLTIDSSASQIIDGKASLTISNGSIVNDKVKETNALFGVGEGSLILSQVKMNVAGVGIYPYSSSSYVEVKYSTINAGEFAIATNQAKGADITPKIVCESNTMTAVTPVCITVPATVTFIDCTLTGSRQGAVLRCGTYEKISGTSFILDLSKRENAGEEDAQQYYNEDWGDNNLVPVAPLVLGNRNSSMCQYQTYIKSVPGNSTRAYTMKDEAGLNINYANVYMYANQGDQSIGILFDNYILNIANVPSNDTTGKYGTGYKWGSDNIWLQTSKTNKTLTDKGAANKDK